MLVYSVTETLLAGYGSTVVLEICLPPKHWRCAPQLTILATCLYSGL